MIWLRIVLILIGYGFGLFQTGYLYGKTKGIDLRTQGSGNTGATNALRVFGVKGGLIVLLFDALKAFLPCILVRIIFRDDPYRIVYLVYTGIGAVLGNNYPVWLRFKGGKGVATTAGWTLAWDPLSNLICIVVFAVLALTTRIASLSSIIAGFVVIGTAALYGFRMFEAPFSDPVFVEFFILVVIAIGLVILRHRDNIKRLLIGTENRFGKKKK